MACSHEPRNIFSVFVRFNKVVFDEIILISDHFFGKIFGIKVKFCSKMNNVDETIIVTVVVRVTARYRCVSTLQNFSKFNPHALVAQKIAEDVFFDVSKVKESSFSDFTDPPKIFDAHLLVDTKKPFQLSF